MSANLALPAKAQEGLGAYQRVAIQILFVLAMIGVWHGVATARLVSPLLLPSPASVFNEFVLLASTAPFWTDVSVTLSTIVASYALAVVAGMAIGILVGQNRFAYDVFSPIFSSIFAIPLIILYPLALYVAGVGPASKIVFAASYGFFPVAIAAMSGFANVPPKYTRYVSTLGASRWLATRKLLIPAALPEMLSGLRVGFVITFASVIAGEMIAAFHGVGRAISYNAEIFEPARMYAMIAAVVVFAAGVNSAVSRLRAGASS
jgi:NitT/TauT family transport system permease protein